MLRITKVGATGAAGAGRELFCVHWAFSLPSQRKVSSTERLSAFLERNKGFRERNQVSRAKSVLFQRGRGCGIEARAGSAAEALLAQPRHGPRVRQRAKEASQTKLARKENNGLSI